MHRNDEGIGCGQCIKSKEVERRRAIEDHQVEHWHDRFERVAEAQGAWNYLCGAAILFNCRRIVLRRFGYPRQIRQCMSPAKKHAVIVGIAFRRDVEVSQ